MPKLLGICIKYVSLPEIMGKPMGKYLKIVHDIIIIEYDVNKTFMLISETDHENILFTYSVKMPVPNNYSQLFPYYSEILN
jgi:hypothetical protein